MNHKILIIEDNAGQATMLDFFFKSKGFDTIVCECAEDGFGVLENNKDISLITLDINLPGMNGLHLLAKIKENAKLKHVPIVMISALCQKNNKSKAIELGANDYFVKPISLEELEKIVDTYLKCS